MAVPRKPAKIVSVAPVATEVETVSIAETSTKAADPVSAGPVVDLQGYFRKATEQGLEQTRTAYARIKAGAEDASGTLESSFATASKGIAELNSKTMEAVKLNTDSALELWKALTGVKSISEAVQLQTEHARKQFETLSEQVKDLSSLAQKIATDSTAPIKTSLSKTFAV